MDKTITFEEWLDNKKYQRSFTIQIYVWYNHNVSTNTRNTMELEDFRQHMLMTLFKTWKHYNSNYSCITYSEMVVKRESIRLMNVYNNHKNKIQSDSRNIRIEAEQVEKDTFEIPFYDNEGDDTELMEYLLENVEGIGKDICRLYLNGVKLVDIVKFSDLTYRQVQYMIQKKYIPMFQRLCTEYYS